MSNRHEHELVRQSEVVEEFDHGHRGTEVLVVHRHRVVLGIAVRHDPTKFNASEPTRDTLVLYETVTFEKHSSSVSSLLDQ